MCSRLILTDWCSLYTLPLLHWIRQQKSEGECKDGADGEYPAKPVFTLTCTSKRWSTRNHLSSFTEDVLFSTVSCRFIVRKALKEINNNVDDESTGNCRKSLCNPRYSWWITTQGCCSVLQGRSEEIVQIKPHKVCSSTLHCARTSWLLSGCSFPGSQPVSFGLRDIEKLKTEEYVQSITFIALCCL